jgi:hypothetical protein
MKSNYCRGKTKPQEDAMSRNPSKGTTGGTPVGYSGYTALRREQCNEFPGNGFINIVQHATIEQQGYATRF